MNVEVRQSLSGNRYTYSQEKRREPSKRCTNRVTGYIPRYTNGNYLSKVNPNRQRRFGMDVIKKQLGSRGKLLHEPPIIDRPSRWAQLTPTYKHETYVSAYPKWQSSKSVVILLSVQLDLLDTKLEKMYCSLRSTLSCDRRRVLNGDKWRLSKPAKTFTRIHISGDVAKKKNWS